MVKKRSDFERFRDVLPCIRIKMSIQDSIHYLFVSDALVVPCVDTESGFVFTVDEFSIYDTPVALSTASINSITESGMLQKYIVPELTNAISALSIFKEDVKLLEVELIEYSFFCVPAAIYTKNELKNQKPTLEQVFSVHYILEFIDRTTNISYLVCGAQSGELMLIEKSNEIQPFRFNSLSTIYNIIIENPLIRGRQDLTSKYNPRDWNVITIKTITVLDSVVEYEQYNKNKSISTHASVSV